MVKFKNGVMHSKRIRQLGDIPIKRHSCSLVAVNKAEFALFGGESINGDFLNDLWYFNVKKERWIELFPAMKISTRQLHISIAYRSSVIVFGGMTEGKLCLSDLSTLRFGELNGMHKSKRKMQFNDVCNSSTEITLVPL